jgi:hypothetical protein
MIGLFARLLKKTPAIEDNQWLAAEQRLPCLRHLSQSDRLRLRSLATRFIAEKRWSAAGELQLLPSSQIEIALQACLLILNLGLERYRHWLGIVVYPGDFVIPRSVMDEDGVVHEYDDPVLGEAWEGGPVILSWFDNPDDAGAANVVLHEFAHKLDMENGKVDGIPRLPTEMSRQGWISAFEPAYEDFCRRVDAADRRGEETLIDPYGSEHPAEFFAVLSEAFFETPEVLRDEYPEVYDQLRRYYGQDPAAAESTA